MKQLLTFENENAEREFWQNNDSSEYLDWSKAVAVILPKLQPSTERISLRLPKDVLDNIKLQANKRDIPYQSLIKYFLYEAIQPKI